MPGPPLQVRVTNLRNLVFWALGVYIVWRFIDAVIVTVLVFAVAFLFALVLDPPIRWLDRHGLSRGLSVGIIVLALLIAVGLAGYYAIPPLMTEASELLEQVPDYAARLQQRAEKLTQAYPFLRDQLEAIDIKQRLLAFGQSFLPQIGRYSLNLLNGLFSLFLIFVITLYTVADPHPLVRGFLFSLPRAYRKKGLRVLLRIRQQVQAWVRATLIMMLTIGVLCGLGLWALGVRSPLLFGILAGIGEAIPTIGPILTAIPPFLVTLADDPAKAFRVLALFLLVQQIENNLLVPRIMASTLKLHSVSVLFCVVAMGALLGPLGILLATPLCAIMKVLYEEIYRPRMRGERSARFSRPRPPQEARS
ncbi:MAG TPA: AI-2E family transporter [Chthonomonadaceae bacterium]|nr:AI-2E family transporter [Chthonomonadaceae bacterium]